MRVFSVEPINCRAGNVNLKNLSSENLMTLSAIKEIALDKGIDIQITKSKDSPMFKYENIYTVIAKKTIPNLKTALLKPMLHAGACTIMPKQACSSEVAANIYKAVKKSVCALEEKLYISKKPTIF